MFMKITTVKQEEFISESFHHHAREDRLEDPSLGEQSRKTDNERNIIRQSSRAIPTPILS